MRKLFYALAFVFLMCRSADAINVKIQQACGLPTTDLQIEVWNPPGGYLKVNPDLTVTANIPAGTKLSVLKSPMSKDQDMGVFGPWTEASEGATLPVTCHGGMCPPCSERVSYYQERFTECVNKKLYAGHDPYQYCTEWMGTCNGPIAVPGGGTVVKSCSKF